MAAEAQYSISVTEESVTASQQETLLQVVAAASKRVQVTRWGVSFSGVSATNTPVRVELLRLTSAGTSSAFTPKKMDPTSDAALATGLTAHTAEPGADDVLETYLVTPFGGLLVMQYAPEDRPVVAASGRLGIRVLANDSVDVSAFLVFAE